MKGNAAQTKVHVKGKDEDFIVMVESKDAVLNWKKDKSIPLAQVVSGWKVFVTHRQGTQGVMDEASKATLEDEFGTSRDDDVMAQILEKGSILETEAAGRDGNKNDSKGALVAH